jgi:hypothetical protein
MFDVKRIIKFLQIRIDICEKKIMNFCIIIDLCKNVFQY